MREENLNEQRTAIYEKTKQKKKPGPGSLKQKLADKGVCLWSGSKRDPGMWE